MSPFTYKKTEVLLKAENISLSIDGNLILRDLNAEIKNIVRPNMEQGQIVGCLGPSGIGKTKFFEILAGMLKPTNGSISVGHPLQPVHPGMVGVVQQSYPLFQHRTIYSNLEVAASCGCVPAKERKERIMKLLSRFGMEKYAQYYPAQLSGGQRQRIAIAQQLLCSDHFLLLDEPFSGLDILMLKEVCDMLKEISCFHEENTIIIISHDIAATAAISDTLWIMGRERDNEDNIIPGARILYTCDLIERGIAWQPNVTELPEFQELVREVRHLFPSL